MSILIKGMEMPKNCLDCPCCDDMGGAYCRPLQKKLGLAFASLYKPDDCPLVEVPEQKHGQWIKSDDGFDESWVCSECMEEYVSVDADFIDYAHYCPNCGARMVTDDV